MRPSPTVIPPGDQITCHACIQNKCSPQILVVILTVMESHDAHDLRPKFSKRAPHIFTTSIAPICPPACLATPPRRSTHLISPCSPKFISFQAMHHIMTLEAFKVATNLQWTCPIINIKEICFGVVHPVTIQTITQYKILQHDPDLKDLWVLAMSKEVHRLAQGKVGIRRTLTQSFFFLTEKSDLSQLIAQLPMLALSSTTVHRKRTQIVSESPLVAT